MNPCGSKLRSFHMRSCCLLAAFLVSAPVMADETDFSEAVKRLNQMSMAMSQMTYQGTFVYVQGDLVETMRITHVVDEDGIHERLVAQTGPQRELLRDSKGVRWIAKDRRAVVSDPVVNRAFFPQVTPGAIERAGEHYTVRVGGLEPIAGRLGRRLSIKPKDQYRYGYNLWLEDPSGLLLKWELFEKSSRPLARLMFTDIRIGQEVDRGELKSNESMEDYQSHSSDLPAKQAITHAKPRWAPSKLPPGFKLTTHRRENKSAPELFQHLVYSDGIATVSVYVELAIEGQTPEGGTSRLGTTHAFSRLTDEVQVIVIGDVPAATVKEIAQSVSRSAP